MVAGEGEFFEVANDEFAVGIDGVVEEGFEFGGDFWGVFEIVPSVNPIAGADGDVHCAFPVYAEMDGVFCYPVGDLVDEFLSVDGRSWFVL